MLLRGAVADVAAQLRYPAANDLLFGFDEATQSIYFAHQAGAPAYREAWGAGVHKRLVRLAEAVGAAAVRLQSSDRADDCSSGIEALLDRLDESLGFKIDFPNPYPGEFGLKSSRGLINHRAVFAIYQAWRLFTWTNGNSDARVLEIGAGSGRTAYYARKLGLRDYTIIDLPLTNVAQANFLGRVLDPALIVLSGESDTFRGDCIRVFGSSWLGRSTEKFDVALNADSITEMDCRHAVSYFEHLADHTNVFISINHEANPFSARELPIFAGLPLPLKPLRFPYWLDDGYVEEMFLFCDRPAVSAEIEADMKRMGRIILDLKMRTASMDSIRALARRLVALTVRRLIGR